MAGAAVFDTRVRVHLGVLAGLFLMSVALGYQLDKFELVHSDRGVATGVSFTDQNAQFLAYDVLTGISAIAAAFLVGGAFARVLWPLGLTLAVWFIASIAIGRLYPAAIQQFTVVPNQFAQEESFIANNIAMTRLAFDLNDWTERAYRGDQPLTQAEIDGRADTFANARLWDYRPLGDTLDQLQTVRTYYDFVDVDTDRYLINGELRQVMLSGRELDVVEDSNATGLGDPADHLHPRHRRRDGPGQRGRLAGPATAADLEPAAGVDRRRAADLAAPDLLRRGQQLVGRRRRPPARVRLPARRVGRRCRADELDRHVRHPARHDLRPAPVRDPVPRPEPPDQRPGDERQPAPLPPDAERSTAADRAVPEVRQGSLPRHRRRGQAEVHPGRVHDQRPVPARRSVRSRRGHAGPERARAARTSTTSGTA